ncbi:g10104 [Coccomyxa viridis]|uniref:G10104 protein n=1 Tax=Coccomyxa viridis TaxID=1274662 RepID=A0ABP1G4I2_9CHLO
MRQSAGDRPSATALCILLLTVVLLGQAHAKSEETPCVDERREGSTYGQVRLPNLKVEASLRSKQPREAHDITIITQCSLDRLYMLEEQCNTWGGVTSVAVYLPLVYFQSANDKKLQEAISHVEDFHEQIDRTHGRCRMDIVLLSEVIKEQDLWAYPYNALRNQALSRADTDVLLLLDADFIASAGLHEFLTRDDKAADLMEDLTTNRKVIVLPAFETEASLGVDGGGEMALKAQASTKQELKQLYDDRQVVQFAEFYPVGHRSTNYKKWFSSPEPYPIRFKSGYEPYVLVARKIMPWYDERFRGYGWDKVMQIYQMDAMNFHFVAHPNAWVVHRPHAPSSGYNHTFTGEAYTLKHKPTDHLWKMERIAKDMMAELKVGSYPDEGVTQLADCREKSSEQAAPERMPVWWK